MSKRKAFLLRIDPNLLDALQQWAENELRSLNGQIEFLLRQALKESGRLPSKRRPTDAASPRDASKTRDEP